MYNLNKGDKRRKHMATTYTFPISPLCFWVKGSVEVGDKVTKITTRNTVLGIIPAGSNKQSIPMSNVSTVQVRSGVMIGRIALGIILIFFGLECASSYDAVSGILAILLFGIIGVATIIAGLPVFLDVETAGATRTFYAPIYAKGTIEQIADDMNEKLAGVEDRKDTAAAADKIVDAIKDNGSNHSSNEE